MSLIENLINIPSLSGNEEEVARFLFNLLSQENFKVNKLFIDNTRFNVLAQIGEPKIYLQAHMDTVAPFISFSENKEFIFGRGACDAKGSMAAMIQAAVDFKNHGGRDFGLIFTVGEETKLDGVKKIIADKIPIPFIVVGEPTSLDVVSSHYGLLVLEIICSGRSAHSSTPEEGINAIDLLLKSLDKIKKIKIPPDTLFALTKINGGLADNIIPPEAAAVISFRISPIDKNNYLEIVKSILPEVKVKKIMWMKSVSSEVPAELSFLNKKAAVKYFTELSFCQSGVVFGPGDIIYAHRQDEKLSKSEFSESIRVYYEILKRFTS